MNSCCEHAEKKERNEKCFENLRTEVMYTMYATLNLLTIT